ncbi:MAG: hypothetical protein MJ120_02055 [Clostridia bacterium]|nr:hypothetical protein [Clostridia bacterium]
MVTTAITYFAAVCIQRCKDKTDREIQSREKISKTEKKSLKLLCNKRCKTVVILTVCINLCILGVFKYGDFVVSNIWSLLGSFGVEAKRPGINLLLPLGISFYTFQSIGYLVDVYRNQVKAEKNFLKVALFVSYFPQIIEGPIGRFNALAPQLFAEHDFSFERMKRATFFIFWGMMKKMVIADNIAPMTEEITKYYTSYSGITIIISMLLYGVQLYADFSGYMDVAMGLSCVLGIDLAQNFNRPYFSRSLSEFWRRWHISLCSWFRDYLFYPISTSKKCASISKKLRAKGHKRAAKNIPIFIAMAIVWFFTGLWHGANWTEILWGVANGLIMIFSLQVENKYKSINKKLGINTDSIVWKMIQVCRTYILVTFLNYTCEFTTLTDGLKSLLQIFTHPLPQTISLSAFLPRIASTGIIGTAALFIACGMLFSHSLYEEKKGSFIDALLKKKWFVQAVVMIALAFYLLIFGNPTRELTGGFMYAKY